MAANTLTGRKTGFDFLKFIGAFLVICIHTPYAAFDYLDPYARVAVPIFFMITGYFYESAQKRGGELRQIKKIFIMLLWSLALYLVWDIFIAYVMTGKPWRISQIVDFVPGWLDKMVRGPKRAFEFFALNAPNIGVHLWYLSAILYVLVFIAVFSRFADRKKLYPLIPLLLAANLILGCYAGLLLRRRFGMMVSRNWIFCGLPFFLLGDMFREYKGRLRFRRGLLWAVLLLSLVSIQLERIVLSRLGVFALADLYFSSILSACAMFLLADGEGSGKCSKLVDKLALWGRDYSTDIYIFHPMVVQPMLLFFAFAASDHPENRLIPILRAYFQPFIVLVICLALLMLYSAAKRAFWKRKN